MLKPHYSASQLLWWLVIAGRSPIIVGLAVPIVEFAVGSVQFPASQLLRTPSISGSMGQIAVGSVQVNATWSL